MSVRLLTPDDAAAFVALRRDALTSHPLVFAASLEDDRGLSLELMRASLADVESSAIFGAFEAGALVGIVGAHRAEKLKMRHKVDVWGMYVAPGARGRGVGDALLRAVIDHCRSWPGVLQIHLSVTEAATAAARLYERAGFREWGREPRALLWDGRPVDERHLVLDLDLQHLEDGGPKRPEGTG
jgi:RimJ/RimL family protein N-acetyltransferase